MVAWIICIVVWSCLIIECVYFSVRNAKHRKRFNALQIGCVYGVIYEDKKIKNPFLRTSVEWCFLLLDKQIRKGRCYVKYRRYDRLTNTLGKDEYAMEYCDNDIYAIVGKPTNMSIWQRYDNLTDNVSTWLEDLEYITSTYKNDELQDLIKGYKNEIANYKKVLV